MTRRRQLTTADPQALCLHDHVAWCGDGSDDLYRLATAAFTTAAERGELMLFVAEEPRPARLAALDDLDGLVERGALRLQTLDDAYDGSADPCQRQAQFADLVDAALAEGYRGLCVVADNTPLARGGDDEFVAWLAWEAMADQLQAARPLTGVCYFDRRQVPMARLADLATVHPVISDDFKAPSFQLFFDGDAVRVLGSIDSFSAEQLCRILTSAPTFGDRVLDLTDIEFVNHRALLELNRLAATGRPVRLSGAPAAVHRVWDLLELSEPALEFV